MGGDRYRASWYSCAWRQSLGLLVAVASIGLCQVSVNAQQTIISKIKQPAKWNQSVESVEPASKTVASDSDSVPRQAPVSQNSQFNFFNVVTAPQDQPQQNRSVPAAAVRPAASLALPREIRDESTSSSEQGQSKFNMFNVVSNTPAQSKMNTRRPTELESQLQADSTSRMNTLSTTTFEKSSGETPTEVSHDDFFKAVTGSASQPMQRAGHSSEPVRVQPSSNSSARFANENARAAESTSSPFSFFNVVTKAPANAPANDPYSQTNAAAMQPEQYFGPPQANFFNVVTKSPAAMSAGNNGVSSLGSNGSFKSVSLALQDDQNENDGEQPARGDLASSETQLGSAPPSNELVFLRRQTVLLAAGQTQFDTGFAYSHLDDDRPVAVLNGGGDVVGVVEARTRQRLLVAPFEIRYGLTDRIQLFANTTVGWSNAELAFNTFSQTQDVGGIGDSNVGMSMLLKTGECDSPDVVFTLGSTAPTGNDTLITTNLVPNAQLGQGFWSIYGNLLFVHTWDPIVVFYGAGYNHRFDHTFVGVSVNPGEEFDYQLGVGFAVNSNVSLSGSFQGAYITEFHANDDLIEGSTLEPMRARLAVTVARNCRIWEPFVEIPMTDDAAARVGMVWTF